MTITELPPVPERTDPTTTTVDVTDARAAVDVAWSHLEAMRDEEGEDQDGADRPLHDALYDAERVRDAITALEEARVALGRGILATGDVTQARVSEATGLSRHRIVTPD